LPATSRSAGSSVCTSYVDFSQARIEQRWEAGYAHTRAVLARKPWARHFDPLSGVILHEAKVLTALAAE
jgi:NTE family protein